MLETLYKKAKGYEVVETTREYGVDANGDSTLLKEKTATKHVPPDLSAIKAYMELKDAEIYSMSEEELQREQKRLIKELRIESGELRVKDRS